MEAVEEELYFKQCLFLMVEKVVVAMVARPGMGLMDWEAVAEVVVALVVVLAL